MTNPDNAIGTNAAYDGRTSVDAFNDDLAAYSRGVLSGWECKVYTGLTVMLGGSSSARDVAIAQDNVGNKTTINNISRDEVLVTVAAAPASNSRIDAIVAYVDNPPQGNSTTADNPSACGIIAVSGTPSATPVQPTDNMIRTAITADGASGTTAYYAILATVTVPTGTTDLIQGYITQGAKSTTSNINIADGSITANKLDFTTYANAKYLESVWSTTGIDLTKVMGVIAPSSGKYLAIAMGGLYSTNDNTATLRLGVNGVSEVNTNQLLQWAASTNRISGAISYVFTVNQGDSIDLFAASNEVSGTVSLRVGFNLAIIRIG